ncbi:MAG: methyltransferase domain-containing protein [Pseudomonadota bacterium]
MKRIRPKSLYGRLVVSVKYPFMDWARRARMERLIDEMDLKGGERILDIGGYPSFWAECPFSLKLTILNLPGAGLKPIETHHEVELVEGDGCELTQFANDSFDIAFSNSVIEHVGSPERQRAMAAEAQRVASGYWVQTPSIWFPMEAHTNMPFWWFYPESVREALMRRWRRRLPAYASMLDHTTVISHADMGSMFPDGRIWTERIFGLPKSYVAYKPAELGSQ